MNLDPTTTDPRKLADMLRRECEPERVKQHCLHWTADDCKFAAALLAVLDECDMFMQSEKQMLAGSDNNHENRLYHGGRRVASENCVRAAADAYAAAGGTLPAPEGE